MKKFPAGLALLAALLVAPLAAFAQSAPFINAQTVTTYTFVNTDCSKIVTFTNASATGVTLPQASSVSGGGGASGFFLPPCSIGVQNLGAGQVTITPTTSTIGGNATLVLNQGQGASIVSDGTNYQVQAGGVGTLGSSSFWTIGNSTAITTITGVFAVPSGAHTSVQEWLIFKDAAGTTRWLPAF